MRDLVAFASLRRIEFHFVFAGREHADGKALADHADGAANHIGEVFFVVSFIDLAGAVRALLCDIDRDHGGRRAVLDLNRLTVVTSITKRGLGGRHRERQADGTGRCRDY